MALPATNISISLVKSTIGEASNDVKGLCTSEKINKWSRIKPFKSATPFHNTVDDILSDTHYRNFGLKVNAVTGVQALMNAALVNADWDYEKPDASYRLGDFRNYSHAALPPIASIKLDNANFIDDCIIGSGSVEVSYVANTDAYSVKLSDLSIFQESNWKFGCCLMQGTAAMKGFGTVTGGSGLGNLFTVPLSGMQNALMYRIFPFFRSEEISWTQTENPQKQYCVLPNKIKPYFQFTYYTSFEKFFEAKSIIGITNVYAYNDGSDEKIYYHAEVFISTSYMSSASVAYTNFVLKFVKSDGSTVKKTITVDDFTLPNSGGNTKTIDGSYTDIQIMTYDPKYMVLSCTATVTYGGKSYVMNINKQYEIEYRG